MKSNERERRDWVIFVLILMIGIVLMLCTGQYAVAMVPRWSVEADVKSNLNPDDTYSKQHLVVVEPIKPEILTPPVWQDKILTPAAGQTGTATVIPIGNFGTDTITPTGTISTTPSGTAQTSSPTTTIVVSVTNSLTFTVTGTRTNTATATRTYTASPTRTFTVTGTRTNTATPTRTFTSTPTRTYTRTNTSTPTRTYTRTNTMTSAGTNTNTPVSFPTSTRTPTSPPAPTSTRTSTPVNTSTSTYTFTPTNTPIPPTATSTNTPVTPTDTHTPTATPIPPTDTHTPTATPVPPTDTDTPTATPIPPTDTDTPTVTPIPPTDTDTPTTTPIPPTDTDTPTATPVPPTDTHTPTFTPTPTETGNRMCGSVYSSDPTGTIRDSGGSSANYSDNEVCTFLIQPGGGGSWITLSFSAFNTEMLDVLTVYDGVDAGGDMLGVPLWGVTIPGSLTAKSGSMFLSWTSDISITNLGYVASWSSVPFTATPTNTPTPTQTDTPTLTPTDTPTNTPTFTPTVTNTPTETQTPTDTLTPTETPTPTDTPTSTFTPTDTHTPTPTFTPPPPDPQIQTGTPDGVVYNPPNGSTLVFDLGIPLYTMSTPDGQPDLVYFEMASGQNIQMDRVIIELGDFFLNVWYMIFNWGDGVADTNSNMDINNPAVGGSESDNQVVRRTDVPLYGTPALDTGITIDIDGYAPTGTPYQWLRISIPLTPGNDGADIDSILVLPTKTPTLTPIPTNTLVPTQTPVPPTPEPPTTEPPTPEPPTPEPPTPEPPTPEPPTPTPG